MPRNIDATSRTQRSRNARGGRERRGASHKLGKPPQVLCDRCQSELELRTAGTSKAQSTKPQNTLQVSEQHFDLLAIAARLREHLSLRQNTGNVTGFFVDAARDPTKASLDNIAP